MLILSFDNTYFPHPHFAIGHSRGSPKCSFWKVGLFTDTVERVSTNDGSDETDFYYPIVKDNKRKQDAFPLVVFLQGGLVDKSLYSNYAKLLAAEGYVVVIPNHLTQMDPFAPPRLFASQWTANDVLADVEVRDQDPDSPLYHIVNTDRAGISGHSNGGAAAMFVTADSTCQPPFCFGPYYTKPDAFQAAAVLGTHTVPIYGPPPMNGPLEPLDVDNVIPLVILQGSLDDMEHVCATWPLIEDEKDLVVLEGVNHWGVTNIQNPPTNTPDEYEQTVSQAWSNRKLAKWTAVVFDAYLKDRRGALLKLERNKSERGVTLNYECSRL